MFGGDLPLCVLHDVQQTHALIQAGQDPMAAWVHDRPVVLPCGPLQYRAPVEVAEALDPFEDPLLAEVPDGIDSTIFPAYDLTRRSS